LKEVFYMEIVKQDQWCNDPEAWQRETLAKKAVEALKANWFDALYVPDREAAAQYVLGFCAPARSWPTAVDDADPGYGAVG
jgi:hypothetical protein